VSPRQARTTATIVLFAVGLWVLVILARPFTRGRALLVGAMVVAFVGALAIPFVRNFYAFRIPPGDVLVEGMIVAGLAVVALELFYRIMRNRLRQPGDPGAGGQSSAGDMATATPSSGTTTPGRR
jgi:cation-transporting ATPase E